MTSINESPRHASSDRPSPELIAGVARSLGFGSSVLRVEPMISGVSTWVYQLQYGPETFYLRVLPEADATFAPEIAVHQRLCALGLRVPQVVAAEQHHALLARPVMVTTAIHGWPLRVSDPSDHRLLARVLREAGAELAVLNQVPVAGFGWVQRHASTGAQLVGEYPSYRAWVDALLTGPVADLAGTLLTDADRRMIQDAVVTWSDHRVAVPARLAHGDLDLTHIFHLHGHYTGIIDFGEIRGADPWYDLAHFRLHDGESLPVTTLSWLLDGYRRVTPLPPDLDVQLAFDGLVNGLVALTRRQRQGGRPESRYTRFLRRAIQRNLAMICAYG